MDFLIQHWIHWSEFLKNVFTALAILTGGIWALFRFRLFREHHSRMELRLGYTFLGLIGDEGNPNAVFLVELCGVMENKGAVAQRITNWTFDLRLFRQGDRVQAGDKQHNQNLKFEHEVVTGRKWISGKDDLFIDAGTVQQYRYLISVPGDTQFIHIDTRFTYGRSKFDWQEAARTFKLANSPNSYL